MRQLIPPIHREFAGFFLHELLPLIEPALIEYQKDGILKTDYDFAVTTTSPDVLWYLPNEVGGTTVMLPDDY